jgi:hypothetical protein
VSKSVFVPQGAASGSPARVCILGEPGSGKTRLAATFPDPVFLDLENGAATARPDGVELAIAARPRNGLRGVGPTNYWDISRETGGPGTRTPAPDAGCGELDRYLPTGCPSTATAVGMREPMERVTQAALHRFLQRLGERFDAQGTLYMLGGSALCMLGSPRTTVDVDYMTELPAGSLAEFQGDTIRIGCGDASGRGGSTAR